TACGIHYLQILFLGNKTMNTLGNQWMVIANNDSNFSHILHSMVIVVPFPGLESIFNLPSKYFTLISILLSPILRLVVLISNPFPLSSTSINNRSSSNVHCNKIVVASAWRTALFTSSSIMWYKIS